MPYHVYILASQKNGTLYIGRTENIVKRMHEHKKGLADGFTKTYGVKTLVHLEAYDDLLAAAEREKRLKNWNRDWKINLIERENPTWQDLTDLLHL